MDGINLIDYAVLFFVLLSAALSYLRGLVQETINTFGWFFAALATFSFAPEITQMLNEIPLFKTVLTDHCELKFATSLLAIFVLILGTTKYFINLLMSLVDRPAIKKIDKALGFLFGTLRGVAIVCVVFFGYKFTPNFSSYAFLAESKSALIFYNASDVIGDTMARLNIGWINLKYEKLVFICQEI